MNILLALGAAIISAVAAISGVYFTNRGHEKRLRIQFENDTKIRETERKVKKLEEMFILFQRWEMDVSCLALTFIPVYEGECSASEAKADSALNRLQEKGDYQKFQAILNLHFPELKDEFWKVMHKRGEVMKFCRFNVEVNSERLKLFISAQKDFENQTAEFRSHMSELAHGL
ncbi:hypothetical protein [Alteromonas flava]|uniref:hypothetical protein n=1 Tax=Alteromonas flava TaxID=2048003 RepID=UPI000C283A91|nr:hypothetical protein [Alteromonas flava]